VPTAPSVRAYRRKGEGAAFWGLMAPQAHMQLVRPHGREAPRTLRFTCISSLCSHLAMRRRTHSSPESPAGWRLRPPCPLASEPSQHTSGNNLGECMAPCTLRCAWLCAPQVCMALCTTGCAWLCAPQGVHGSVHLRCAWLCAPQGVHGSVHIRCAWLCAPQVVHGSVHLRVCMALCTTGCGGECLALRTFNAMGMHRRD